MLSCICVAEYFLSKDKDSGGRLFNKVLVHKNGRDFYEGNAKLNKFLHLAQNIYIAKTGEKLFNEDMYAYDNGAVVPEIQENYAILLSKAKWPTLPPEISDYLARIYEMFKNAPLDELIELSHEDDEWMEKHPHYRKCDQKMDSLAHVEEYRKQYKDAIKVLDRMIL